MSQRRFQKLYLDSRFAQEGLGSDITFQLPQQVLTTRGDAVCCQWPHHPKHVPDGHGGLQ